MLHYIIQVLGFQLFFLIIYDVFLKKETFFNWNRTYLLVTAVLSLIIPFVKISSFKRVISQEYLVSLPEIIIGKTKQSTLNPIELSPVLIDNKSFWSWELIFCVGLVIATILFIYKLVKVLLLLNNNPKSKDGKLFIVKLLKSSVAFSFFNYIFLGDSLKENEREAILKHEIVHVKQKHTLDLLFFELLRILFWFNPLVYMYQNRIMSLHEFIADDEAVKNHSKKQYYQNLLSQVFETKNMSFINPFFKQSLIKKRIIMLQKSKSKQFKLVKYALLIPLVFGMLVYTSCMQEKEQDGVESISIEEVNKGKSKIIETLEALKSEIEKHGGVTELEREGLDLLLQNISSTKFNPELVEAVKEFSKLENQSVAQQKMVQVFNQIQEQGNIADEEFKALKTLLLLTSENGFNNPFFDDVVKFAEIPFGVIDQVPVFPGCENMTNQEQKNCMSRSIFMHVNRNFNTKLANSFKLEGRQRINVVFKISNEGDVIDIRSRAAHPSLEAEAIRVINILPKFAPGEHNGKKVNVLYSLPIIFQVKE